MNEPLALLLPVLLLACSAFFSASETALFSLSREERHLLRDAGGPGRCALELLSHPRRLLIAVLFGNLLVNFLLFAISANAIAHQFGQGGLVLGGILVTGTVILLGEITPKAIAVARPRRTALLTAPLLLLFRDAVSAVGVLRPLEGLVGWALGRVERRWPPTSSVLTDDELVRFVELQGEEGLLERHASEFLAEALELRSRRVHEVMTPRVDIVALDLRQGHEGFLELVRRHRFGKVPVHQGEGLDTISGYLLTREVLAQPERPLAELVCPIWFVPRTKSLESLLREMVERKEHLALVLGEYGGTAGLVTLEDLVEEITGDIARDDAAPLLQRLDEGSWQLAGRFPLREVSDLLEVELEGGGSTTLSGFVAHHLGRIPEIGDVVQASGIQFRVEATERRRASRIRVQLPTPGRARRSRSGEIDVPEALTHSGAHRANRRLLDRMNESGPGHRMKESGPGHRTEPPA